MDQKLHVVQRKLLNVVPELVFLIHSLEKSQGGGPHLEIQNTNQVEPTEFHTDEMQNCSHLLFFVGAEIQEHVQVLKLPRGPLDDELLQSRHAQVHPGLKQRSRQHSGSAGSWVICVVAPSLTSSSQ